jgi:hypothetical protein
MRHLTAAAKGPGSRAFRRRGKQRCAADAKTRRMVIRRVLFSGQLPSRSVIRQYR